MNWPKISGFSLKHRVPKKAFKIAAKTTAAPVAGSIALRIVQEDQENAANLTDLTSTKIQKEVDDTAFLCTHLCTSLKIIFTCVTCVSIWPWLSLLQKPRKQYEDSSIYFIVSFRSFRNLNPIYLSGDFLALNYVPVLRLFLWAEHSTSTPQSTQEMHIKGAKTKS